MYLTECYVENFGVLHQYHYQPERGLNSIYAGNGTGKSTFAAFIRAMFYGMPATRTRKNLEEAERKKYKPWQEGLWGGYLCFCIEGRNYKLERTFSDLDKKDTFRLIDLKTGLETKDFSDKIGEEIFGVDRTAFGTTMFVTQAHLQVNVSDSISQRLDGKTVFDQDTSHFNKAIELLDAEYKQYIRTGRRGMIPELEQKISELESRKWDLKKEIDALQESVGMKGTTGSQNEGFLLTKQQQEKLAWLDDYFSSGIPEEEEISSKTEGLRSERVKLQVLAEKQQGKKVLLLALTVLLLLAAGVAMYIFKVMMSSLVISTDAVEAVGVVTVGCLLCLAVLFLFLAIRQQSKAALQERLHELEEQEMKLKEVQGYRTEYMALSEKEQEYEKLTRQLKERQKQADMQAAARQNEVLSEQSIQLATEINECRTRLEEYRQKAEILAKTREYLEQAQNSYAAGYMKDVAGNFAQYLALFDGKLAKKADVTIKLDVNITENGMIRELDYFSSGIKDIAWFCERMAIADAVFQKERPFMILDDPFVNLDDKMIEKAFSMLRTIAESTQILYMTCQSNRMC